MKLNIVPSIIALAISALIASVCKVLLYVIKVLSLCTSLCDASKSGAKVLLFFDIYKTLI